MKPPTQWSEELKEWVLRGLALEKGKGLGKNATARMLKKLAEASELSGGNLDQTFLNKISQGMVPKSIPIRIDRRYATVAGWLETLGVTTPTEFFEKLEKQTSNPNMPFQLPQPNSSPQESVTAVLRPGQTITIRATHPNKAVHVVIYGVGVKVEVV